MQIGFGLSLLCSVSLAFGACQGSRSNAEAPNASLASTRAAESDFRQLRQKWQALPGGQRSGLLPELRSFLRQHPDDGLVPTVKVYLALALMDAKQNAEAQKLLMEVRSTSIGSARDLAELADAARLISDGNAQAALVRLRPLRGKLIGADERWLHGELTVRGAIAAGRWTEGVLFMRNWLIESEVVDVPEATKEIRQALTRYSTSALENALQALDSGRHPPSARAQSALKVVRKLVLDQLASAALAGEDTGLARRLVDSQATEIDDSDTRLELSKLAQKGVRQRNVEGRSLGLVMSVGSTVALRRSARVSTGVLRALGMPRDKYSPDDVKLIVRDDSAGLREALFGMLADGALSVIVGMTEEGASEAVGMADELQLSLLVPAFARASAGGFSFVLGEDPNNEALALSAALAARGFRRPVRVDVGSAPCETGGDALGADAWLSTWHRQAVDSVLIVADDGCAHELLSGLRRTATRYALGFGLEAAPLARRVRKNGQVLSLAVEGAPQHGFDGDGAWYEALGHDAATLVDSVMGAFSTDSVSGALARERHLAFAEKLRQAEAELLTSDRSGFEGAATLQRSLGVQGQGARPQARLGYAVPNAP